MRALISYLVFFILTLAFSTISMAGDSLANNKLINKNDSLSLSFDKILGLPSYVSTVKICDTRCSGNNCIATGVTITHKKNGTDDYSPLLLISRNNGESWTYSTAGLINLMHKAGALYHVAHVNNNWIVSGYYHYYAFPWLSFYQATLLLVSQDNGRSWQEVGLNGKLPAKPDHGIISGFSCFEATCLAVGIGGGDKNLPLISRSENAGLSWSLVKNISGISVSGNYLFLSHVTCQGETCIAAESLHWSGISPQLLLASHDKGKSWAQAQTFQGLPTDLLQSGISDINCSDGNNCVAVGSWKAYSPDHLNYRPMILASNNGGDTWLFVQNIAGFPENTNWRRTYYTGVNCTKDSCVIKGELETSDRKTMLFQLLSYDKGLSWSYMQTQGAWH